VTDWKRIITTSDFSEDQIGDLQALVFTDPTVSISRSHTSFEKGVPTQITFTYSANVGDDTFISGQILNNTTTVEEDNVGISGVHITTGILSSVRRKYKAIFTEQGTKTSTLLTSTATTPQYVGVSEDETFDNSTYVNINSELDKFLSTSNFIQSNNAPGNNLANSTIGFPAVNQYIYFISKNDNLVVYDQTNLPMNMTTEFAQTTISVKLANGTDQTMYQYRSVKTKDFSTETGGEIGYKLASA
jgi:hypothetical protein